MLMPGVSPASCRKFLVGRGMAKSVGASMAIPKLRSARLNKRRRIINCDLRGCTRNLQHGIYGDCVTDSCPHSLDNAMENPGAATLSMYVPGESEANT